MIAVYSLILTNRGMDNYAYNNYVGSLLTIRELKSKKEKDSRKDIMKNRIVAAQASYILPYRGGKVLVGKRCNTGYMDGVWQVFAGHGEVGELPSETVIREASEELGILLDPQAIKLVHVSCRPRHDATGNRVDFYFKTHRWGGTLDNAEPHKCSEIRWVNPNELPEPFTPHVKYALHCIQEGTFYSELTLEWMKEQLLYALYG